MRFTAAVGMTLAAWLAASAALAQTPGRALFDRFDYEGADPPHAAPIGPDQFRNPILGGFYPDPGNVRVGEAYYLVTSTFAWFPGIPVFRSRDLVNWTQIGNAIDRPDQLDFGNLRLSRGVFAPTIEHHDGLFYILNTCVDCGGNFLITATDPAGPWSDPVWMPELVDGIDPSLFFDAEGQGWILNNGPPEGEPEYQGHRAIWIQRFDPVTQATHGPRTVLVNGGVDFSARPIWIEGPNLIYRNGWYYLVCAEGGTAEGHSQVALRSRRPDGPYEANPDNPILTQRGLPADRPWPITSAGHADLVETPAGDWWATFLAVRPYGDDRYNTGRETFLLPVNWSGDWPRITAPDEVIPYVSDRPALPASAPAEPPMGGPFAIRETFNAPTLGPDWMMLRNPRETWFDLTSQPGWLSLNPRPVGLGDSANPSFLARRQQHMYASAETTLRWTPSTPGDEAGMAALQSDEFWYAMTVTEADSERVIQLRRRAGADQLAKGEVIATRPLTADTDLIQLRIVARADRYDFLYAEAEADWTTLMADADGTILSTRTAGGFVGAVFGLYARSAD